MSKLLKEFYRYQGLSQLEWLKKNCSELTLSEEFDIAKSPRTDRVAREYIQTRFARRSKHRVDYDKINKLYLLRTRDAQLSWVLVNEENLNPAEYVDILNSDVVDIEVLKHVSDSLDQMQLYRELDINSFNEFFDDFKTEVIKYEYNVARRLKNDDKVEVKEVEQTSEF